MRKLFTLFLLLVVNVALFLQAQSLVSVTDNSIAEWNNLPADYVSSAGCPEDAAMDALVSMKVYADQVYINLLVEYDADQIVERDWPAFHIYLNTDYSDDTGGYSDLFLDPNTDVMLENAFYVDGEPNDYDPAVFKWWGEVGGYGWCWTEHWAEEGYYTGEGDKWGAIIGEGEGNIGHSQIIDDRYIEIQLLRELIPTDGGWNDTEFGIGVDIIQNWSTVGVLPIGEPTEDNSYGWANKLKVRIDNETPVPNQPTDEILIGDLYYILDTENKTAEVTFHIDESEECNYLGLTTVNIPSSVEYNAVTYSVTSIGQFAFASCCGLTSVTIGSNITSIKQWAFFNCTNLASVTIPDSITYIDIDSEAFGGSNSLPIQDNLIYADTYLVGAIGGVSSYTIKDGTKWIGNSAFYAHEDMLSISIPNSVTSIGDKAFHYCYGLTSVEIPNSVTSIGSSAFYGCTGLTSTTIGNSVTSIGNNAFSNCTGLTSVIWNAKNQSYYSSTSSPFYDARTRITSFVFGEDVEYIPAFICSELTNLTSIVIGSNVKSIGDYAFANINNRKINRLALPANLETIGSYAFAGNTYLEEIDFGSNLASIGTGAFDQCARVYTMTCLATMTPDVATDALTSISSNAELYVLKNCIQKYNSDENWNRFVIKEIATTETDATGNTVVVEAGDNTATFTWPTNSSSTSYSLEIKKDGETVCTLVFNGEGQLTTIAFAPSKDGRAQSPAATQTASGMQFTVTGLDYATNYSYSLVVKDANSQVIASYSGTFGTNGAPAPEGFEKVESQKTTIESKKFVHDGQVLIQRGEKIYTLQGQEVK